MPASKAAMITRLHHVAFAEGSDKEALSVLIGALGLNVESTEGGEGLLERMLPVGDCYLQALEATGEGVVSRSLARRGPGLHHIAFEVQDIDSALDQLRARGLEFVDETPTRGGGGHRIAFVHPRSAGGLLLELVELSEDPEIVRTQKPDATLSSLLKEDRRIDLVSQGLDTENDTEQ